MKRATQTTRKFHIPDADMISEARSRHTYFVEDKEAFAAFDADFGDPFSDEFLQLIEKAESNLNDEQIKGKMSQLTAEVETAMENCRTIFQQLKYFIEKAFPNDNGKHVEFGYREYSKIRNVQNGMIQFMRNLSETVTKYSAELLAAKCPQTMIDEVITNKDALIMADTAQDSFVNSRPTLTQNRILALNSLWDKMSKVCEVGKIVFSTDYARQQLYTLPQLASSSSNEEQTPTEPAPEPA